MTTLHLSLHGASEYLNNPWAFGVNVSRASLLLRKEIQRHLLLGRDDLGFRHVRFHHVFDDAQNVLQADCSYDFTRLEQSLDWLMEQGFAPYLGLSGVPAALRQADSPLPMDLDKWADMCRALAAFIDGRYGCDAQEWHFEVWRAPDDTAHWPAGQDAYFRLYDQVARGIKSVNGQLKVGGPGSADPAFTSAFLDHVSKPSEAFALDMARCDFVAVTGAQSPALVESLREIRQKVTTALGESTPLILSDWGFGPAGLSVDHDNCAAGAAVVAAMAPVADVVAGAMYTQMSDVDAGHVTIDAPVPAAAITHVSAETQTSTGNETALATEAAVTPPADLAGSHPVGVTTHHDPFHGGAGLVTVNDVRKASFNVMKLLNEHIGYKADHQITEPIDGLSLLVTRDYHHVVRILASYHKPGEKTPAKFAIDGLPESVQWGQVQVIRPGAGSPLELWVEQHRPRFVNRYLLDDLESASHPAVAEVNFKDFPPRLESGMTLQLTIPIPDDVLAMD